MGAGTVGTATSNALLALRNRATPIMGRTWMQHALPVTFGLKAAGWLDALLRHQERIAQLRVRLFVLQFGGAAGTLASLGKRGPARPGGASAGARTSARG